MKYAFVGLGAMGLGMAKNMLQKKLDVTGIDLSEERLELFKSAGGAVSKNLADIIADTDIIFLMVISSQQVKMILTEEVLKKAKKGLAVVSCSTISVEAAEEIEQLLKGYGISFVDCPVSGGEVGATKGSLTLMVSGSPSAVAFCRPALESFSANIYTVGEKAGQGSTLKILHQHLAGIHIAAAVEAMGLCIKCGIQPQLFYDIVTKSAGNSWMFEYFINFLIKEDYTPYSSVDIFQKDLSLVKGLAESASYDAAIARQAWELFTAAKNQGLGSQTPIKALDILLKQ